VVRDHYANVSSLTYRAVNVPKPELALMAVVATSVARKVISYVSHLSRSLLLLLATPDLSSKPCFDVLTDPSLSLSASLVHGCY
jgi:hypothetical protein